MLGQEPNYDEEANIKWMVFNEAIMEKWAS